MKLSELARPNGATHAKKRCGLGRRGGQGKTSGRGQKGQRSRSGHAIRPWLEGGQMALVYRIPKRGFTHVKAVKVEVVNLRSLAARFAAGSVVDPAAMASHGLIRGPGRLVKILGDGALTHPLVVKAHRFSQTAAARIVEAGGQAETLPPPPPLSSPQGEAAPPPPAGGRV